MKEQTTLPEEASEARFAQASTNGSLDTATIQLLAAWRREDATDDPEEIRAAEQELAEFKRVINENRTAVGETRLYP
jgi:hypothetical protein